MRNTRRINSCLLSKRLIWLAQVLILAAIYYGAARLAQSLAIPPGNITPVWPASGISLAAVLLLGYEVWPGIWIGEFLESIVAFFKTADRPPVPIAIAVASGIGLAVTVAYLLGSFLLRRYIGKQIFLDRATDVFKFVSLAAILSCAVSATIGTTSITLGGLANWVDYPQTWWTWFLGDTVGIIIVTPALLIWNRPILHFIWEILCLVLPLKGTNFQPQKQLNQLKSTIFNLKFAEAIVLLTLLAVVSEIAFGGGYPVSYLVIPLLVWAAFRFGNQGATLLIIIVSSIAIWGTVHGHGPFVRKDLNESLLLLQSFVGVVALTTLVLSALISEKEQAQTALLKANDELEQRVSDRTMALSETNHALRRSESQFKEQATQLENTLHQLKQTQSHLLQSEKMSCLGQLVAGVAHEINNPVNFIFGNVSHAKTYADDLLRLIGLYRTTYPQTTPEIHSEIEDIELDFVVEDLPKVLDSMKMGASRIGEIVRSLRTFSRLDESSIKEVDLHEGIDSTLMILQNRLKAKPDYPGIEVIKEYGKLPLVECYSGQLNQVFMNVLTNAIDAVEDRGKIDDRQSPTIKIRTEVIQGSHIVISITDNGPGIPESLQSKLFDPFFTTKPIGKGTGLGLSISYQIVVEKHKGSLRCNSQLGKGTEFAIEIPINKQTRS